MTDPVDILRELNPVPDLAPPAIEPLWARLAGANAGGPAPGRRRRPSFGGLLTAAVLAAATVLAVVIVTSIHHRAGPPPVPLGAPLPVPHTPSRFGVAVPATARLLTTASDPSGGLPWGLRSFRTTRDSLCLQIGRVRGRELGLLGAGGDFRPMAASPVLDAHCAPPGENSIAVAERFGGRTAYFGLVPDGVTDVEYRYDHGRGEYGVGPTARPPFEHGPQSYLQLPTHQVCTGPTGQARCQETGQSEPLQVPTSGASVSLLFMPGEPCPLHVIAGTAAGACRLAFPRGLAVARAQVASPVHVQVARAATFCYQGRGPNVVACPASPTARDHRTSGAGQVLITLTFRVRISTRRGYYGWSVDTPCGQATASEIPTSPALGSIDRFGTLAPACSGRYTGSVIFTPQRGSVFGRAVTVGRYAFVLNP